MNTVSIPSGEQVRNLADKIAKLITDSHHPTGLDKLQASIEDIRIRLEALESSIPKMTETAPTSAHPSQDRFQIAEVGIETLDGSSVEKACPYEPSAKPCDHCSMCSSRGF